MQNAVLNPKDISIFGLASSAFARHYSRNLGWFLFLRVLRCFSSPRSPHVTMYSLRDHWLFISVVSQFGNLRIEAYLQLPAAYRSLSRPSSAPDAKAFTLCSFLLELLSLLSIAWVSQIICYNEKAFFLTMQSGIFRFRLRNAIHWIARNILGAVPTVFQVRTHLCTVLCFFVSWFACSFEHAAKL